MTGSELSGRRGPDGAFATLIPPHGDSCLRVQRVRSGAGGRHLDLHVDLRSESLTTAADRAAALGARVQFIEDGLIVLESPGGLSFCLVDWAGEATVPDVVALDGGPASRLDQVCVDVPPERFAAEGEFWSTLTGWEHHPGSRPEFAYLERPVSIPIRMLLQRRAVADAADRVTAHLDLATDDVPALVEQHVAAGAQVRARQPNWVTLLDPVGQPYCITGRDPRTGRLPVPAR